MNIYLGLSGRGFFICVTPVLSILASWQSVVFALISIRLLVGAINASTAMYFG
tara:strand:- start:795 stop:953 length:159 start_codon:yes stop_codon:yes gene_type:complete